MGVLRTAVIFALGAAAGLVLARIRSERLAAVWEVPEGYELPREQVLAEEPLREQAQGWEAPAGEEQAPLSFREPAEGPLREPEGVSEAALPEEQQGVLSSPGSARELPLVVEADSPEGEEDALPLELEDESAHGVMETEELLELTGEALAGEQAPELEIEAGPEEPERPDGLTILGLTLRRFRERGADPQGPPAIRT